MGGERQKAGLLLFAVELFHVYSDVMGRCMEGLMDL